MSLYSISQLLYLDRVGRADFSGCHLEEIWLFVTGLSHANGNVGESTPSGNCYVYSRLSAACRQRSLCVRRKCWKCQDMAEFFFLLHQTRGQHTRTHIDVHCHICKSILYLIITPVVQLYTAKHCSISCRGRRVACQITRHNFFVELFYSSVLLHSYRLKVFID